MAPISPHGWRSNHQCLTFPKKMLVMWLQWSSHTSRTTFLGEKQEAPGWTISWDLLLRFLATQVLWWQIRGFFRPKKFQLIWYQGVSVPSESVFRILKLEGKAPEWPLWHKQEMIFAQIHAILSSPAISGKGIYCPVKDTETRGYFFVFCESECITRESF